MPKNGNAPLPWPASEARNEQLNKKSSTRARRRAFERLRLAEARIGSAFDRRLSLRIDELIQDLEVLGGPVHLLYRESVGGAPKGRAA